MIPPSRQDIKELTALGETLEMESKRLNPLEGTSASKLFQRIRNGAYQVVNILKTRDISTNKRVCRLLEKKVHDLETASQTPSAKPLVEEASCKMLEVITKLKSRKLDKATKQKLEGYEKTLQGFLPPKPRQPTTVAVEPPSPERIKEAARNYIIQNLHSTIELALKDTILQRSLGRYLGRASDDNFQLNEIRHIEVFNDFNDDELADMASKAVFIINKGFIQAQEWAEKEPKTNWLMPAFAKPEECKMPAGLEDRLTQLTIAYSYIKDPTKF